MAKPKPNKRGRPLTLTPGVRDGICHYISLGNYRSVACDLFGVSKRTFNEWIHRGKTESSGLYHQFLQSVLEAEREAEIRMVAVIVKAAADDPKAAQWWLERKYPERWASCKSELRELRQLVREIQADRAARRLALPHPDPMLRADPEPT